MGLNVVLLNNNPVYGADMDLWSEPLSMWLVVPCQRVPLPTTQGSEI